MDVFAMEEAARHNRDRRMAEAEQARLLSYSAAAAAGPTRRGRRFELPRLVIPWRRRWMGSWTTSPGHQAAGTSPACAEGIHVRHAA